MPGSWPPASSAEPTAPSRPRCASSASAWCARSRRRTPLSRSASQVPRRSDAGATWGLRGGHRPMTTLDRYLAREILLPFAAGLLFLTQVLIATQILAQADVLLGSGVS